MDTFFVSMRGKHWTENGGWIGKEGDLCNQFGITVEDDHVVAKICLADKVATISKVCTATRAKCSNNGN